MNLNWAWKDVEVVTPMTLQVPGGPKFQVVAKYNVRHLTKAGIIAQILALVIPALVLAFIICTI